MVRESIVSLIEYFLIDFFAAMQPEPTKEEINIHAQLDRQQNPYNDSYKPKLRSIHEIVADIKYTKAEEMVNARNKRIAAKKTHCAQTTTGVW